MIGKKFGKLTVVSEASSRITPNGSVRKRWICKCECGSEKCVNQSDLRSENTTSCGSCVLNRLNTEASKYMNGHRTQDCILFIGAKNNAISAIGIDELEARLTAGEKCYDICRQLKLVQ